MTRPPRDGTATGRPWRHAVALAARLLLLVALALLPPLAIQAWNGLEQRREREAVAQTRALQGNVARLTESMRQFLVASAEAPATRAGDAAGCTAYLQAVARQHPAYFPACRQRRPRPHPVQQRGRGAG